MVLAERRWRSVCHPARNGCLRYRKPSCRCCLPSCHLTGGYWYQVGTWHDWLKGRHAQTVWERHELSRPTLVDSSPCDPRDRKGLSRPGSTRSAGSRRRRPIYRYCCRCRQTSAVPIPQVSHTGKIWVKIVPLTFIPDHGWI